MKELVPVPKWDMGREPACTHRKSHSLGSGDLFPTSCPPQCLTQGQKQRVLNSLARPSLCPTLLMGEA